MTVGVVGVVGVIWRPRHMQGAKIMQEVAGAVAMVRGPGGGWRCEDVVEGWAGNGVCVPEVGARGGLYGLWGEGRGLRRGVEEAAE
jgi:hypothetical protein